MRNIHSTLVQDETHTRTHWFRARQHISGGCSDIHHCYSSGCVFARVNLSLRSLTHLHTFQRPVHSVFCCFFFFSPLRFFLFLKKKICQAALNRWPCKCDPVFFFHFFLSTTKRFMNPCAPFSSYTCSMLFREVRGLQPLRSLTQEEKKHASRSVKEPEFSFFRILFLPHYPFFFLLN